MSGPEALLRDIEYQMHAEVLFGPRGFFEAWGAKLKKPHILYKNVFFLALVPLASKKHLAPKPSGSL